MTAHRRPRVLVLIENISYRQDTRCRQIARALVAAGYDISVICPRGQGDPRRSIDDGVAVTFFRSWDFSRLGFAGHILEYVYCGARLGVAAVWRVGARRVDIVHLCVPPHVFFPIGRVVRWLGARLVVDQHDLMPELFAVRYGTRGRVVPWLIRRAERAALTGADHVLVTNRTGARVALTRARVAPARVTIALTCPDLSAGVEQSSRTSDPGRITIGYVGNMQPQDGISLLIQAVYALRTELGRTDVDVVCVGDGAALPEARKEAARLGVSSAIEFTGRLRHEEALRRLAACDICVQPDPRNEFNDSCTMLKTLEYMALGKPIVAFDLTETVVACEDAALYASNNSPVELAERVAELAGDPEKRALFGRRARRRIDTELAWSHTEPALIAAYRALTPARLISSAVEDVERGSVEAGRDR